MSVNCRYHVIASSLLCGQLVVISYPPHTRLPARNGLVNEVEFLGLIPQNGGRPMRFIHLHSSIRTFFERVFRKLFWALLGYTVTKAPASPRNLTWSTRPFLLVRGWGLGMRLGQSVDAHGPVDHAGVGLAQARTNYIICTDKNSCDKNYLCMQYWSAVVHEAEVAVRFSELPSILTCLLQLWCTCVMWLDIHIPCGISRTALIIPLVIHLLTFWSAHLFVSRNWCTCLSPWVLNCTIQCT